MGANLIPLFDMRLRDEDIAAAADTLRSGWLTMGPRTQEFEQVFAERLGAEHAVAVSSGTAALHLAYLAAGVGPEDEVIVPAITFVATAAAVRYCGGTVVLADVVGPHDLGLDPSAVEAQLGPRTRAVCAMHFGGYAARVEELRTLCEERGIALLEDAAHSPLVPTTGGARKLGTFGLAGAFSFFSNKVLSCGEGGLLATDDEAVAERARRVRSHAMTSSTWERHSGHSAGYDVVELGFNYRLDETRAALLKSRLEGLDTDLEARRRLTLRYRELLADVEGLLLPYEDDEVRASACYVMPVLLEQPEFRDPLRRLLLERYAVQTSVLYPAIHHFTAYADVKRGPLPNSELVGRSELTLPLFPHMTEEEQDRVVRSVREGLAELT